jgi:hypothetical protein
MNESQCPIAMEIRGKPRTKGSKSRKNAKKDPKIRCGFYELCERPDKGKYPECGVRE